MCNGATTTPESRPDLPILQLKARLLDVSPMVWRRLLIPAVMPLRELHGVLQVAMGWEGVHLYVFELRARRYGSLNLCTGNPDVPLDDLRLRIGGKLRYLYDMGDVWRHEVRVEGRLEAEAGGMYPLCLAGAHPCLVEDSGGPVGWRERRRALVGFEALEDLAEISDVLASVAKTRSLAVLDEPEARDRFEAAVERMEERKRWLPNEFCRIQVNERFRREEHKQLMHQQLW